MITVKKDAIKYKSDDGTMKSTGVLCNLGVIGGNPLEYARSVSYKDVIFSDISEITLNLPNAKDLSYTFQGVSGLKKVTLIGNDTNDLIDFYNAFYWSTSIETIDLSGFKCNVKRLQNAFSRCTVLKEIIGELDLTNSTNNGGFGMSNNIQTVRFKKESIKLSIGFSASTLLDAESVQSIIDGLADLTDGTAQTLAFHETVKSKLTEAQIASITSKNWTLA